MIALSPRELEVCKAVHRSLANKEIAWELNLTIGTVKEYLYTIFRKLDVRNRVELALYIERSHSNSERP